MKSLPSTERPHHSIRSQVLCQKARIDSCSDQAAISMFQDHQCWQQPPQGLVFWVFTENQRLHLETKKYVKPIIWRKNMPVEKWKNIIPPRKKIYIIPPSHQSLIFQVSFKQISGWLDCWTLRTSPTESQVTWPTQLPVLTNYLYDHRPDRDWLRCWSSWEGKVYWRRYQVHLVYDPAITGYRKEFECCKPNTYYDIHRDV